MMRCFLLSLAAAIAALAFQPLADADEKAERLRNVTGLHEMDAGDLKFPDATGDTSNSVVIILLLTVISIAPSLLVLCTSFTRIVVVLSLTRNALGLQGVPLVRRTTRRRSWWRTIPSPIRSGWRMRRPIASTC